MTKSILQTVVLTVAVTLSGLTGSASAVDFSSYRLGDFYPVTQATDRGVQEAAKATVFFGNATGFVISPEGHVLTNHHVYETFGQGGTVYVQWQGGNSYARSLQLSLVARSATYDVALYKANVSNLPYLKIDERAARVGEDVFVVGHPNTRALEVSFGKVLATGITIAGRPSIEYSAQTWWGSSGSPVCDRAGNVLAIHWGWDANGQSNGRLTGVPFNLITRAVPEIAAVARRYGVGAAAVTSNTGTGSSVGSVVTPRVPTTVTPRTPSTVGSSSATTTTTSSGNAVTSIPLGSTVAGVFTRTGDLAYYTVSVPARGDLTVTLAGPAGTDFDMAVYHWSAVSSTGAKAGDARGASSAETLTIRDANPGTYVVVVNSYDGAGSYRVGARVDQRTTVTAGVLGGTTDVLTGAGDWRLYTINAPAGALRVSVDGPTGADFDVYVFAGGRVDANSAVAIGDSEASDESVAFQSNGGAYSILVRSAEGAGRFDVTLAR